MLKWTLLGVVVAAMTAAVITKGQAMYAELLEQIQVLAEQARTQASLVCEIEKRTSNQITALANKNTAQDVQINDLDVQLSTLKLQNASQESQLSALNKQLSVQASTITTVENNVQELIATSAGPKVAFTAYSTFDQPAAEGKPLVFDSPVINEGKAYDPETGKFAAPVDGVYAFFCSLKTTFVYSDVNLKLGDSVIVIFSSDDTLVGGAVKFLKSGEEVFLKPTGNLGALQGSPISPASTFWGFKIY
ncbi:hypothetical protein BaRGS_00000412 [Batillaria attramentaria]|uniref:C1q domain-containing protein n=1 Tax=Batillaria attramentaria TaxID=370345 RepID=A0ABD0MAA1_9CAEN